MLFYFCYKGKYKILQKQIYNNKDKYYKSKQRRRECINVYVYKCIYVRL